MPGWVWIIIAIVVIALIAVAVQSRSRGGAPQGVPTAPAGAPVAPPPPAPVITAGPHEGSVMPAADGSSPSEGEYAVKANSGSKRYHSPESPFYVRTRADLWFRTEADAERAGFGPWNGTRAT